MTVVPVRGSRAALESAQDAKPNLSRCSANLVAMYDRAGWAARLAYNWRDRFLSGTANIVGVGTLPVYTAAYGWLDASLAYQTGPRLTMTVEGNNLLRTTRVTYYGVPTRPQSAVANDRQVSISAPLRF